MPFRACDNAMPHPSPNPQRRIEHQVPQPLALYRQLLDQAPSRQQNALPVRWGAALLSAGGGGADLRPLEDLALTREGNVPS